MTFVPAAALRGRFAHLLSRLYAREVPAYETLVAVTREVNLDCAAPTGADAGRLGSMERVTAERHGAIRVGTPQELQQVARVFAGMGMHPTGFYDLRDAGPSPVPVVSTAFRPIEQDQLAANPFRVFTSLLVPEDRRFFSPDLQARLQSFLSSRVLFPRELLTMADRASAGGGLDADDATRFLELASTSFALSKEPVDRAWYDELQNVSSVAADIGGVRSTHINHLTPRVLDIDDLYGRMSARGIEMIEEIQGPPRWSGPDLLLRQTSFRALDEQRLFRDPDGTVRAGLLRVRFGEVEARGIALTLRGRERYDQLMAATDEARIAQPEAPRDDVARAVWDEGMPGSEAALAKEDLAFFTYRLNDRSPDGQQPPLDLPELLEGGWVIPDPIVYEDFLPRSAAGIFSSNLTGRGNVDANQGAAPRDAGWLADALGRNVHDPVALYAAQRDRSLAEIRQQLDLPPSAAAPSPTPMTQR